LIAFGRKPTESKGNCKEEIRLAERYRKAKQRNELTTDELEQLEAIWTSESSQDEPKLFAALLPPVAVATILLNATNSTNVGYYLRSPVDVCVTLFGVALRCPLFLACCVKRYALLGTYNH